MTLRHPFRRDRRTPDDRPVRVWGRRLSFVVACVLGLMTGSVSTGLAQSAKEPHRVYVPKDDLDVLLQRDRGGVFLSLAEYEALLKSAGGASRDPQRLPAGGILSSANYRARIEGDQLLLTLELEASSFDDKWVSLPVPVGGLGVESAGGAEDASTSPALIRHDPETLHWLLSSAGKQTLKLELSAPLNAAGSDRLAAFQLSAAPAGEFRLALPPKKHLQVDGVALVRPSPEEERAEYVLPIGGRKQIELRITDRAGERRADSLTFASTAHGLHIDPGEVTWTARTSLQVIGRSIDQLVATVPMGVEITGVESSGLETWELSDDPNGRTAIKLRWRQAFSGQRTLTFRGLLASKPGEAWSAPNLVFKDVTSHTGALLVEHPPGIRLQVRSMEGVRPVSELNREEARALLPRGDRAAATTLMFELWEQDFQLSFVTEGKERELHAAMTNLLDVSSGGIDLYVTLDLTPLFAPLFDLQVSLPAEWSVKELTVAGAPVAWRMLPGAAGVNVLQVPFDQPLEVGRSRQVTLVATRLLEDWPVKDAPVRFALPDVKLPQANVVEAIYGIIGDADLEIAPVDVTGLDPAKRDDFESLQRKVAATGRALRLGFSYQDTTFSAQLEVRRKPTRVSAATLTFVELGRETVTTHLEVQLRAEGGGLQELKLALPEAVGEGVQFRLVEPVSLKSGTPLRILEQSSQPQDGKRVWTLRLDRRLFGDAVLAAEVRRPREAGAAVAPIVPEVLSAERQNGHIAVLAGPDQHITLDAKDAQGQPLPLVDPVDFPASFSFRVQDHEGAGQRMVASVQYLQAGYSIAIRDDRFLRTAVPTALCRAARFETVVSPAGDLQHEARFELVAVGVQGLALTLPKGSRLWSASVDGRPVEVRQEGGRSLLPLPAAASADAVRDVRILYEAYEPPLGDAGTLVQQPPRLAVVTGLGAEQPVEILQQEWVLHRPAETLLVGSQGKFHPRGVLDGESLLDRLARGWSLPSARESMRIGSVLVAVAVLAGIWIGLRRRFGAAAAVFGTAGVLMLGFLCLFMTAFENEESYPTATVHGLNETAGARSESLADAEKGSAAGGTGGLGGGGFGGGGNNFFVDESRAKPADAPATTTPAQPAVPQLNVPGQGTGADFAPLMDLLVQDRASWPGRTIAGLAAPPDFDVNGNGVLDADEQLGLIQQGQAGMGALLSLALHLAPPADYRSETFTYNGSASAEAAPRLEVTYIDRTSQRMTTGLVAAAVLFLLWWFRRRSFTARWTAIILTIAVPLALMGLAPAGWLTILDGFFIAGVIAALFALTLRLVRCALRGRICPPSLSKPVATVSALLLFLAASTQAVAQEASKAQAPPPSPPGLEAPAVILPYDPKGDPLAADSVYVPQKLFLKLWQAAHPEERVPEKPPAESLVAAVVYSARLDTSGEKPVVQVRARLVLRNLTRGPVRIPLPIGRVAVDSAELDGKPASLVSVGQDSLGVLVEETGSHVLDLAFALPSAQSTAESGRFTLPLKPVATGRLSFDLPGSDQPQVRVTGAASAYRLEENGRRVTASVDRGGDVTVAWQPRTRGGSGDALVQVESALGATLDDAGLHLRARFRYQVRQGQIGEVRISLTRDLKLRSITGADVAGWEEADEQGTRRLRVLFRRDIGDRTELTLDAFQPFDLSTGAAPTPLPAIVPEEITRETGEVVIFAAPQLSVQTSGVEGLRQINIDATPMDETLAEVGATPRFAYRFSSRPFALKLSGSRQTAETRVTAQQGVEVTLRKLLLASRFQFELRDAPRASLSFLLPADYLPLDVQGDFLADWYVSQGDAGRLLTVELDRPRTGAVELFLEGNLPRDPATAAAELTLPQPLDVERQESWLGIWVEDLFTAAVNSPAGWRSLDPAQLDPQVRALREPLPQFAFRSSHTTPGPITVSLQRSTPELSADAVLLVAVSDASVDYGLTLRWTIERAATDQLALITPDWLGEKLEFQGEGLRQVRSEARPGGTRLWQISLQRPVKGQFLLSVLATLPLPADDVVKIPDVRFPVPGKPVDDLSELATQRRFLVLVNLSKTHQLSLANGSTVEPAARDQLPLVLRDALLNQAVEIASLKAGRPLPQWRLSSVGGGEGAAAIALLADLRTALARDGTWRLQGDFRIRNRGRQFLAVRPPANSRLLSVIVRGVPSQGTAADVGGKPALLVPLPATSAADLSFDVRIVFAGALDRPLPKHLSLTGVDIELPAAQIVSSKDSAEFGMPVLQTLWRVDLPDDLHAVVVESGGRTNLLPGGDEAAREAYSQSIFDELRQQISDIRESARRSQVADSYYNIGIRLKDAEQLAGTGRNVAEQQQIIEAAKQKVREIEESQVLNEAESNVALQRNDSGRGFIASNGFAIVQDNRQAAQAGETATREFGFSSQRGAGARVEGRIMNADRAAQSKSRAMTRDQLSEQAVTFGSQLQSGQPESEALKRQLGFGFDADSSSSISRLEAADQRRSDLQLSDFAVGRTNSDLGAPTPTTGGLSLPIDLPEAGRRLTFTKIGGEPRLTLSIRPRETYRIGVAVLWGAACLAAAIWFIRRLW